MADHSDKLHPILVRAVAQTLHSIFRENTYADKAVEQALKWNPKAGSKDRAFIAETSYEIVRYYRLYEAIFGRMPMSQDDFWKIVGIHLVRSGRSLPDWMEFRGLHEAQIKEELLEVSRIRKLRESIPDWIDRIGEAELGGVWDATLAALNHPAQVVLRCNRLKTNPLDLQKTLSEEHIETEIMPGTDALILKKRQNVFPAKAFREGMFEVQDFNSQQVGIFLDPKPGLRVVDACAGAGGKTLHLASLMESKGSIIALDKHSWKLDEMKVRARRAGASNIEARPIDSTKVIKRLYGKADRLLLDVPCTGLGVLRRNPDSKWKLSEEFLQKLYDTQQQILQQYSGITKPGGIMVYATCSILPSENQQQVAKFLESEEGKSFKLLEEKPILPQENGFDGFFMAKMERNK